MPRLRNHGLKGTTLSAICYFWLQRERNTLNNEVIDANKGRDKALNGEKTRRKWREKRKAKKLDVYAVE